MLTVKETSWLEFTVDGLSELSVNHTVSRDAPATVKLQNYVSALSGGE